MRFDGQVAIVTGSTGGIGRAVCLGLAREGADILAVDLNQADGDALVSELQALGRRAIFRRADVSRADEVRDYVADAERELGPIRLFFNNAGIEGVFTTLDQYPDDVFDQVIAVNLRGVFLGMKHVIPRMIAAGGGSIVNTASMAALRGYAGTSAYVASKHAVLGLTRSAALEYARSGVRINALCPGAINTRMMRSLERGAVPNDPERNRREIEGRVPMGRYGEPEEVADLVLFLFSADARYLTGNAYNVDGGSNAG